MRSFLSLTLPLAVLVVAAPAPVLFAQSQAIDGNIEGYVRAADGAGLAGASIRVTQKETGLEREAQSDDQGYFRVQILPPGTYRVAITKDGFSPQQQTGVALAAGQVQTLRVALAVGSVATTVEVTADLPVIETGRTNAYNNVYTSREVQNIPVPGRSFLDLFVVNPIVNAPPLSTGGSGTGTPSVSFGGLGFRAINVDGVSNNVQDGARNLVISEDALSEVQVVTNYSAEFGRAAALQLNAISKSGSNDLHYGGFLFARNKALSARPFLLTDATPTPPFSRYNYGGTASGPLKKNRAFIFGSYERWQQDAPQVSTFGGAAQASTAAALGISPDDIASFNGSFRAHTITVKSDVVLNSTNRLMLRYNYYRDRESPLGNGQITRQVASRFDENPQSGTAQLVTTLGPNKLNEFRFLSIKRDISNGVLSPLTPQINISGVGNYNGNQDGTFVSYESGLQFVDNFTWNIGNHSVKAGVEILPNSFKERTRNLNGTFTFTGLNASGTRGSVTALQQAVNAQNGVIDPATGRPFTYTQYTRAIGQEFTTSRVVSQGYFLQDDWRVNSKLKLTYGLRYEVFLRPTGLLNTTYPATGTIPQDYNNLAPRLGVAYDPIGDGKTVIRAGYGIYYNTTVAQTFNTFVRGNGVAVRNLTVTPTQAGAPAFTNNPVSIGGNTALLPSDLYVFAPSFQDPMVHQYFATFERQLMRDQSLSVSYFGNHAVDLPYSTPSNLTTVGTAPNGGPQYGGTTNRPNPAFGSIYTTSSAGYQNYSGVVVVLTQRARHGLSFQAAYNLQHVRGLSYTNNFTNFGALTTPSNPANPSADVGPGDFSQPNRFTLTAVYNTRFSFSNAVASRVVNGWTLTSRTVAQSGLPFSPVTGQDNNGDLVFNDRPVGFGYNSYRLPAYVEADFRVSRDLHVHDRNTIQVAAEVFNAPNRLNVTNVNRTFGPAATPNATFNTATAAETARQFQLSIRFTR
ncbi:MAG: carboxypeptidase regulatory-like domain-containing protein [Janthinobacterium lividum]